MKAMLILAPAFLALAVSLPQKKQEDFGLPELHKIKTITLSPSYSCRSEEERHQHSMTSALFLSAFSRQNGSELLFNGACGAPDNFQGISGGDYVGVIADLGEMPLEKLTTHLMFNTKDIASFDLYSRFAQSVKVQAGHTYAVLISSPKVRGMFAFTVTEHVPNKKVVLNYVVKEYQVLELKAESPGFSWETENTM